MAIIKKKTWPGMFELVKSGKKRFDVRLDDFAVNEGDTLVLEEWDPAIREYTGRQITRQVDFVLKFDLAAFGQKEEILEKGLQVIQFSDSKE